MGRGTGVTLDDGRTFTLWAEIRELWLPERWPHCEAHGHRLAGTYVAGLDRPAAMVCTHCCTSWELRRSVGDMTRTVLARLKRRVSARR